MGSLCLCFSFCLLLGSSLSSLFGASSFYCSSIWFLPLASAAVPLSPAPSSSASLSFAHSSVLSLPLFGSAGGGGLSPAQCLWYLDIRRWSLLLILSFLCLFLLSLFLVGSFLCLCFYFCLLLGSSLSSLFGASSFCCSSTWFLPLASAAVPLSLRLLLPRLRSPSLIPLSSAFLSSAPLGGGGPSTLCLCYLDYRRWSLLLIRGFSPWFLLPLLCASCYRFWLFFSASDCFTAGSPFLFSGFAALGWGSAPGVCHGLVLPQVPRPSLSLFLCLRSSSSVLGPLRIL